MSTINKKLTRRQQKLADKGLIKFPTIQQLHFELKNITPITENQKITFNHYREGANLLLHGCAGTGKSFISVYLALKEIESLRSSFHKLIIIRSAQSSKDIGFLPGDEKRKLEVYEAPYRAICSELYHRDDAYEILKQKGIIEFQSTSYLRGTTFKNAIILLDEMQNLKYNEARTVLTRVGENCRIIICGDTLQDDLTSVRYNETSGISQIMKVFEQMRDIATVHFEIEDIVRSGFVKDFLTAENKLGFGY